MRIALISDAWRPQVNGVVRTLTALTRELVHAGHEIATITPDLFRTIPCPSYPEIRLAIGASGRITVPADATDIVIQPDGSIMAGKNEVGRLEVAHFKDPRQLVRVGEALFEAPIGLRSQPGDTTVQQYYRESSNVNVVDEMVQMIAGMRHYEAAIPPRV